MPMPRPGQLDGLRGHLPPGRGHMVLVVVLCALGVALLTVGAILLIRQQTESRHDPAPPAPTGAPSQPGQSTTKPAGGGSSTGPAPGPAGLHYPNIAAAPAARVHPYDNNLRTQ